MPYTGNVARVKINLPTCNLKSSFTFDVFFVTFDV